MHVVQGEVLEMVPEGMRLRSGEVIEADLVVMCTGYAKSYDYLSQADREKLAMRKDGLYLYRHILAPTLERVAFVGSEVTTYNNILTYGLQAVWLVRYLQGVIKLPPLNMMQLDIREQRQWSRRVMPPQRYRGNVIQLYMQSYHDQLVRDMGYNPHRKAKGPCHPFVECFEPYTSRDYQFLFEDDSWQAIPPSHGVVESPHFSCPTAVKLMEEIEMAMDTPDTPRQSSLGPNSVVMYHSVDGEYLTPLPNDISNLGIVQILRDMWAVQDEEGLPCRPSQAAISVRARKGDVRNIQINLETGSPLVGSEASRASSIGGVDAAMTHRSVPEPMQIVVHPTTEEASGSSHEITPRAVCSDEIKIPRFTRNSLCNETLQFDAGPEGLRVHTLAGKSNSSVKLVKVWHSNSNISSFLDGRSTNGPYWGG